MYVSRWISLFFFVLADCVRTLLLVCELKYSHVCSYGYPVEPSHLFMSHVICSRHFINCVFFHVGILVNVSAPGKGWLLTPKCTRPGVKWPEGSQRCLKLFKEEPLESFVFAVRIVQKKSFMHFALSKKLRSKISLFKGIRKNVGRDVHFLRSII